MPTFASMKELWHTLSLDIKIRSICYLATLGIVFAMWYLFNFLFPLEMQKKKIKNKEFTLFPPCKFTPPISSTLIFKFQQILALHLQRFSLTEQGMLSGILLHPGSPTQCNLSCFYLIQRPADICFKALHSQSASW